MRGLIMRTALAVIALASCLTAVSRAESPPPAPESLLACSKLQDPAERVRCYDAQVAAMNSQAAPAPAPPAVSSSPASSLPATAAPKAPTNPPVAAPANTQKSAEARFGAEDLPLEQRPAESRQDALLSSITAMRALGQNKYAFSLANGQVWRQEGAAQVTFFFRIGDQVRIERSTMGGYRLSTAAAGAKNWVHVIRIQ
jgi:hypothetical protein